MIAYFDTSAIVPLLVQEPGTETAGELWDRAERLVSIRLAWVEARAALARAARIGRISPRQLRTSKSGLDELLNQVDLVDVDDGLVRRAGDLAEVHALRAYDAIHLAAADRIRAGDAVVVAGDRALLDAAAAMQMAIAAIT
ncbi:MAG: type II toxin-antitoxin system VapC family toxin [Acidimicrobiia bacterium]|nr:type II toxin-antitoxin system VapC family toxin [Acidimicrobiia bacterium]